MKKVTYLSLILFCLLISNIVFGESLNSQTQSNPDGIVGKPTITLWGGITTGDSKYIISQGNFSQQSSGNLSGSLFSAEILYPADRAISLIFRIQTNWQTITFPETNIFVKEESKLNGYSFVFGIKFYTK